MKSELVALVLEDQLTWQTILTEILAIWNFRRMFAVRWQML